MEILDKIFDRACTDGGGTGCSLTLTSKTIRDVVRHCRFHTVALKCQPNHLAAFLSLHEQECRLSLRSRPRVLHLHLTFPLIPSWASAEELANLPQTLSSIRLSLYRAPPTLPPSACAREPTYDDATLPLVTALLALVAPDLQSLVLQHGITHPGFSTPCFRLFSHPFPSLRDLTFFGFTHHDWLLVDLFAPRLPLFPALTRLHLSTPSESFAVDPAAWAPDTPVLTHFHVSELRGIPPLLLEVLGGRERLYSLIHPSSRPPAVTTLTTSMWPSLRTLSLQRRHRSDGMREAGTAHMLEPYARDIEEVMDGRLRVEVLDAVQAQEGYVGRVREVRREWESRVVRDLI